MVKISTQRSNLRALVTSSGDVKLPDLKVDYAFHQTPLGRCLLGESEEAVCYLAFIGDGAGFKTLEDLASRWPEATLEESRHSTARTIRTILGVWGLTT